MVLLSGNSLQKSDFQKAFRQIVNSCDYTLKIDSLGGDFRAAMEFVREIKMSDLENHLRLEIHCAGSSAAYILFSLNCKKLVGPNAKIIIHGGRISVEANEFFDGKGCEDSREYYYANKGFVALHFPKKMDEFVATNYAEISAEEYLKQNIVNTKRLAV